VSLNQPRFLPCSSVPPLVANAGVTIEVDASNLYVVHPNQPAPHLSPCYLARLPSILLDRPTRMIRSLRAEGIMPIFLLYFDIRFSQWSIWLPPTRHRPGSGSLTDMKFVDAPTRPHDDLRLAGSFRAGEERLFADWPASLPHFDGLHLFLDPGRWGSISAVMISQGQPTLLDAGGFLCEQFDDLDRRMLEYVRRE